MLDHYVEPHGVIHEVDEGGGDVSSRVAVQEHGGGHRQVRWSTRLIVTTT